MRKQGRIKVILIGETCFSFYSNVFISFYLSSFQLSLTRNSIYLLSVYKDFIEMKYHITPFQIPKYNLVKKKVLFSSLPYNKILPRSRLKAFQYLKGHLTYIFLKGRKQYGKRRKCRLPAFSPFSTMFSNFFSSDIMPSLHGEILSEYHKNLLFTRCSSFLRIPPL